MAGASQNLLSQPPRLESEPRNAGEVAAEAEAVLDAKVAPEAAMSTTRWRGEAKFAVMAPKAAEAVVVAPVAAAVAQRALAVVVVDAEEEGRQPKEVKTVFRFRFRKRN